MRAVLVLAAALAGASALDLAAQEARALERAKSFPAFVQVLERVRFDASPTNVLKGLREVSESVRAQREAAQAAMKEATAHYGRLIAKYQTLLEAAEKELDEEEAECDPFHPQPRDTAAKVARWQAQLANATTELAALGGRVAAAERRLGEEGEGTAASTASLARQRAEVERVMAVVSEVVQVVAAHYENVQSAQEKARLMDAVSLLETGRAAKSAARLGRAAAERRVSRLLSGVAGNADVAAALREVGDGRVAVRAKEGATVLNVRLGQDIGGAVFDALKHLQAQLEAQMRHLDTAWAAVSRINDTVIEPQRRDLEALRSEQSDLEARDARLRAHIASAQREERSREAEYASCEESVAPIKERVSKRRAQLETLRTSAAEVVDEQRRAAAQMREQEHLAEVLHRMIEMKLRAVRDALAKAYPEAAAEMGGEEGQARLGRAAFAPTDYVHDASVKRDALMSAKRGLTCGDGDCERALQRQQDAVRKQLEAEAEGADEVAGEMQEAIARAERVARDDVDYDRWQVEEDAEGGSARDALRGADPSLKELLRGARPVPGADRHLAEHLGESADAALRDAATGPFLAKLREEAAAEEAGERERFGAQRKARDERAARARAAESEGSRQRAYEAEAEAEAEAVAKKYGIPLPERREDAGVGAAEREAAKREYREQLTGRVHAAMERLEGRASADPEAGAAQRLARDLDAAAHERADGPVSERLRGAAFARHDVERLMAGAIERASAAEERAPKEASPAEVERGVRESVERALEQRTAAERRARGVSPLGRTGGAGALEPAAETGAPLDSVGPTGTSGGLASSSLVSGETGATGSSGSGSVAMRAAALAASGATGASEDEVARAAERNAAEELRGAAAEDVRAALEELRREQEARRSAFLKATEGKKPVEIFAESARERRAQLAAEAAVAREREAKLRGALRVGGGSGSSEGLDALEAQADAIEAREERGRAAREASAGAVSEHATRGVGAAAGESTRSARAVVARDEASEAVAAARRREVARFGEEARQRGVERDQMEAIVKVAEERAGAGVAEAATGGATGAASMTGAASSGAAAQ